ncbi:hypothetical protein [Companilactobacillus keshanensis]|uniref:Transposase n=1 Tax=Companilactobacillus keshanensis TaxID=2486003 RepID=A0ABW4BSH0_9LACO|nr:hypothetical protein [Companilactobacillus keshanensis]
MILITKLLTANAEDKANFFKLIRDEPWLVPTTVFFEMIPVSIMAYGFWKNRKLKTQLKIEHEKTIRSFIERSETIDLKPEELYFLKHI